MLFLLVSLCLSEAILGIDLGSQYIKFGIADLDTSEIIPIPTKDKNGMLSSVAIKKKDDSVITNSTIGDIKILFESAAARYVDKHPSRGNKQIINAVTRDDNEIRTCKVINESVLLSLLHYHILSSVKHTASAITLSFPSFFTISMRQDVISSLQSFSIPVTHIADDNQALAVLYADTYISRYMKSPRSVMFVDVGYGYAKASVINFTWNTVQTDAYILNSEFSENCGSYGFAKALAKSVRIPISEAEKMLKDADDVEFARKEIDELKKLIYDVAEASGPVDEVQLIGGASRLKFVLDAVNEAVKNVIKPEPSPTPAPTPESTPEPEIENDVENVILDDEVNEEKNENDPSFANIGAEISSELNKTNSTSTQINNIKARQEFDATKAVLLGTLHYALNAENRSIFNPTVVHKKPTATTYVKCGWVSDKFCQKNFGCKTPRLMGINRCPNDIITVVADSRHIPSGSNKTIANIHLLNISEMEFGGPNTGQGIINFRSPDGYVDKVIWCNQTGECYPIEFQQALSQPFSQVQENQRLFQLILEKLTGKKVFEEDEKKVKDLVSRLKKVVYPPEGVEQTLAIDDSVKKKVDEYIQKLEANEIDGMTGYQLLEAKDDLKNIAISLGLKVEE